jgi:hypothetical protein
VLGDEECLRLSRSTQALLENASHATRLDCDDFVFDWARQSIAARIAAEVLESPVVSLDVTGFNSQTKGMPAHQRQWQHASHFDMEHAVILYVPVCLSATRQSVPRTVVIDVGTTFGYHLLEHRPGAEGWMQVADQNFEFQGIRAGVGDVVAVNSFAVIRRATDRAAPWLGFVGLSYRRSPYRASLLGEP